MSSTIETWRVREVIGVNGMDMIRWNDEGKIVDFKVMLRPMKALKVMHQKIAALLQAAP